MKNKKLHLNHKNLIKITNFIVYLLILIGCCFLTYYYTTSQINECTSNPFVFGAMRMEQMYQIDFYGVGYFLTPIGERSPTITFNSTHLSWD